MDEDELDVISDRKLNNAASVIGVLVLQYLNDKQVPC
jgi:hypothetical protein